MRINIDNLLPEEISDEGAYHMVNFLMDLATELESHYFAQMKRHINNDMTPNFPDGFQQSDGDEIQF